MTFVVSVLKIAILFVFTLFVSTLVVLAVPVTGSTKVFHALARFHARGALALAGARLEVRGGERLDLSKSYVYVSNHASLFDIPAILAGIPQDVRLIYKRELERLPVFGWGLKWGKTFISIDRGQGAEALQSLEKAALSIREGASVHLFAEGTRSPDGRLGQFKRGPFNLAVKSGIPVVPVTIAGSHLVLRKKSLMVHPGTITIIIDDPIPVSGGDKNMELTLRDRVREVIDANLKKAGTVPLGSEPASAASRQTHTMEVTSIVSHG